MIALYRGSGLISTAIRWQTRGPYSHAAWMRRDGSVIEAWHLGGVMHNASPFTLHGEDAHVDLFELKGLTGRQRDAVETFLQNQVGSGYDWFGVIRFMSGVNRNNEARWFCSELVAEALQFAGRPVLQAEPWKISPSTLAWSTDLRMVARDYRPREWAARFRGDLFPPAPPRRSSSYPDTPGLWPLLA
jgi:uncharacterized protein YycO